MQNVTITEALSHAVTTALRPLIRILLRHGVGYDAFAELAKRAYVEVGMSDFGIPGKKQSISRVSVLTGLTRKEVSRITENPAPADGATAERYNRAARVIAGWVRDRDFLDSNGQPAALPAQDGDHSFAALVRRHSGDVPARAVLDELVRVGAVESANGSVKLRARSYIPANSDVDKLQILGTDVGDLIRTIDHNIQHGNTDPLFQRKVMYDNLPTETLPEFRALSREQAQELLERIDRWLAQRDRDINPESAGTGRMRAGIGIFYFEEEVAPATAANTENAS